METQTINRVESSVFDGFRKRSGQIVPFRREKIESALLKASRAAKNTNGDQALDERQCVRLTDLVINQLQAPSSDYYLPPDVQGRRIPEIETVQDLVELVLADQGYASIVSCYKRYRRQRHQARNLIKVRGTPLGEVDVTDANLLLVESSSGDITRPWDRREIVRQITEETDLSIEIASEVAKEVENTVISSGIRTVNTALIREIVNNILSDRGYQQQLQDLSIYRVPKKYVNQLMYTKTTENSNIVNNNPEAVNLGLAELVLKQWGLDTIFSSEVKRAHDTGALHLHDLGYPHRVYCSSHSIEYIKKYGLQGLNNLNTESKPARTASVLTGHLNTFLASMQANYAGALGIAYINVFYAPFLVGMDQTEMKQIAQELIFNGSQNAFARGGQTLFLDFNIHTGIPSYLKDVPAIGPGGLYYIDINGALYPLKEVPLSETDQQGYPLMELYYTEESGKEHLVLRELPDSTNGITYDQSIQRALQDKGWEVVTYRRYQEEARRFASALLSVWGEGDKNGRVFEFPKCDFHVSDETFTNEDEYAVFLEACELASKNGSTYFIFDRDEVTLSACCRLRTTIQDNRMLRHPESMRFCGFQNVTINIPQAAYRAGRKGKKTLSGLLKEIDAAMDLAVKAHHQKRKVIAEMMDDPGRPLYQIGKSACDGKPYVDLDSATYIIGLIGVNDAVKYLTGSQLHESPEALEMGLKITAHMFLKTQKLKKEYGLTFSIEESPAESASRRLAKTDLIYFPEEAAACIKGGEEYAYYTNSVHLSADAPVSIVERIQSQSRFHSLIESGAITHAFVGEQQPDMHAIAHLMKKVFFQTQSAQVTISPEFTYCSSCGASFRGLLESCSTCGSEEVVGETRVVGYFSRIQNWNKSKRYGELAARKKGNYIISADGDFSLTHYTGRELV